jgi:hypothetical protein
MRLLCISPGFPKNRKGLSNRLVPPGCRWNYRPAAESASHEKGPHAQRIRPQQILARLSPSSSGGIQRHLALGSTPPASSPSHSFSLFGKDQLPVDRSLLLLPDPAEMRRTFGPRQCGVLAGANYTIPPGSSKIGSPIAVGVPRSIHRDTEMPHRPPIVRTSGGIGPSPGG